MPRIHSPDSVVAVLELKADGHTDREISLLTGVPVNTIRLWRRRGLSRDAKRALKTGELCEVCGCEPHDFAALGSDTYAYLLGLYLGDGCLGRSGNSWCLRTVLDEAYPRIAEGCCDAIEAIRDAVVHDHGKIAPVRLVFGLSRPGDPGSVSSTSTGPVASIAARSR